MPSNESSAAQDQLGPPPTYHFKGNMEYAAPGTNEWARQAWAEIKRLREALARIIAEDSQADWYYADIAREALKDV